MNGLAIELRSDGSPRVAGKPITLRGTYVNTATDPFTLTFWWNRTIRVGDSQAAVTGASGLPTCLNSERDGAGG